MKNEDLYVYKKSDFYEDFISSQKEYYEREQVDMLLAEKDREIALLKEEVNNLLMQNRELCQALQVMYSAEEYAKLQDENAELKQKLESVQASMYADVVDANMEVRRLRRALYKACANWALSTLAWLDCIDQGNPGKWSKMLQKCLKKAEEYK